MEGHLSIANMSSVLLKRLTFPVRIPAGWVGIHPVLHNQGRVLQCRRGAGHGGRRNDRREEEAEGGGGNVR